MSTLTPASSVTLQLGNDLSAINKLTNLNDINRLLHETLAKERAIDAELDKLLSKRSDLERNILLLNTSTSEVLELVRADSEQLLSSVHSTADLADKISGKVRRLDLAQSHVTSTLDKINLIMDRTNCITGVQQALDAGDYEAAANFVSTFINLEEKLSPAGAVPDTAQLEDQRQVLAAKAQLERVVEARFDEAVAKRDSAGVLRYARLFPPLGRRGDGLKRLTDYMRLSAGSEAGQLYAALSEQLDSGKKVDFLGTLKSMFRVLAEAVDEHEKLVREAFGAEAMLEVVVALQAECDDQGTRLLQRFLDARRIQRLVREISGRKRPEQRQGGAAAEAVVDPLSVEKVIQEMLALVQCSEEYCQYMLGRMREAASPQPLSSVRETAFRSAPFCVAVREVVGYYMALEEYYMAESASIAILSDEVVVADALTSTMVDDVFCILRTCGVRALASANMQCAAALLAELNNLLANTFRGALQSKLQGGAAKLLAAGPPLDGSAPVAPHTASTEQAVALNNADVSADYVMKLKKELEDLTAQVFASPSDVDRLRSVLADLGRTSMDFRQLSTRGLEQLGDGLMPRLRSVMDEVASVSYSLSDAEYSVNESSETWVTRLLVALEAGVTWLRPLLTSNNYESLLGMLLDKVVSRLEVLLAKKPFNQLGGLQLDKDVRTLINQVSMAEMSSRTFRDKFSRLSQMAVLLGLESLAELMDYWGDNDTYITWRLSHAEVKAVLSQRADFSKDAIAALQL